MILFELVAPLPLPCGASRAGILSYDFLVRDLAILLMPLMNLINLMMSLGTSGSFKDSIFSSIYSWSIGHILEHELFCLCHLGSQGSMEKKWI